MDQRHRQSGVRLPGCGRGRRIYVVGQQPGKPADSLVQRPSNRSSRRGLLSAGRARPAHCGVRHAHPSAIRLSAISTPMARGYSRFEHSAHGIASDLTQFVPLDAPVKISRLQLHNTSRRTRHLSLTAYVEWVLGRARSSSLLLSRRRSIPRRARCSPPIPGTAISAHGSPLLTCLASRPTGPATAGNSSAATASLSTPSALGDRNATVQDDRSRARPMRCTAYDDRPCARRNV